MKTFVTVTLVSDDLPFNGTKEVIAYEHASLAGLPDWEWASTNP